MNKKKILQNKRKRVKKTCRGKEEEWQKLVAMKNAAQLINSRGYFKKMGIQKIGYQPRVNICRLFGK